MGPNIAIIFGSGLGQLIKDVVGTFKLAPEKSGDKRKERTIYDIRQRSNTSGFIKSITFIIVRYYQRNSLDISEWFEEREPREVGSRSR
jgi:hypothetical protein